MLVISGSRRLLRHQAPTMAARALSSSSLSSLFNPTEEHTALRSMLRSFVEKEVCHSILLAEAESLFGVKYIRILINAMNRILIDLGMTDVPFLEYSGNR